MHSSSPSLHHAGELPLRSHIHHLQRPIIQLHHMPWLQRLGIYIIHLVRVEDARFRAIEYRLFTRRIRKAEASPAAPSLTTHQVEFEGEEHT
jgi:hypothetical protein